MGRPSKRSSAVVRTICEALERGATHAQAAALAGVSYQTALTWRKDDEGFASAVDKASAVAALAWVDTITTAAAKDWKAAAWLLERRYPADYRQSVAAVPEAETRRVYHVQIDGEPWVEYVDD